MEYMENTFVLIKPEALLRGLVGKILTRFENAGLKVDAIKSTVGTRHKALQHYKKDNTWLYSVAINTIQVFNQKGIDPRLSLGTTDMLTLGRRIQQNNINSIIDKLLIVGILSGPSAVNRVKRIVGHTEPTYAEIGTIRGDYCDDSYIISTPAGRAIRNLVHRSTSMEEAKKEIAIWF